MSDSTLCNMICRFYLSKILTVLILPPVREGRHEDEDEEDRDLPPPRRGHHAGQPGSQRGHMAPGLGVSPSGHGLSLTLDSEQESRPPHLSTSAASGERGRGRPGPPCNRAPARGPSPQLIKVKTKKHEHCQEIQKGTQPM